MTPLIHPICNFSFQSHSDIFRYSNIEKFDNFLTIQYYTIYRYRKRYIDIFDLSN